MAVPDLEKIVKIIFAGDDTDLGRTITSVSGGLDTLSLKVGKATQPFADLTDTIIKIDAALAALAVGSLVVATKTAGEFSDSFAEIATIIGLPTEKLGEFQAQIIDYARDSGKSLEDITGSLYNVISAGEDYTTSLKFLESAERLAIGTKADLNTAIEILRPTLTAFGKGTEDAANFANTLFLAVKNGKLTLSELEPVLSNVTGIATASGVSFEEVAAALAALTAAGAPVNLAVTQLKGALTGIFAPAKDAAKAAESLGVEFGKNALEGKSLNEVFAIMVEKTGGTLEGMKALIPRVEGASAALVLGGAAAATYGDTLDQMRSSTDAATLAYETMAKNFNLTNQNIVNNLRATLIEIGLPLLDDWGNFAETLALLFGKAAEDGKKIDWAGFFEPLTDQAEGLLGDLSQYFDEIRVALPEALAGIDWTEFTKAIDDLVKTGQNLLGQLLGGLDLTKAEDLEKAIQKVVDTFTNWVNLTEGLVEGLAPFIVKIGELVSKFAEMDEKTIKSAGEFLGLAKSVNTISNAIPDLTGALNLLSGSIGLFSLTRIPAAITAMSGFGGAAATMLGGALTPLLAGATALAGGWYIGSKIGEDIPILGEAGTAFGNLAFTLANLGDDTVESMEKQAAHTQELAKAALEMVRTKEAAGELANQIENLPAVAIDLALDEFFGDIDFVSEKLDEFSSEKVVGLAVELDLTEFFADIDEAEKALVLEEAELTKRINIDLDAFFGDVDAAEKALKDVPAQKIIEIQLQGEIDVQLAQIAARAENLQTFFEWTAKVEIANIEAQVEELRIGAELVGTAWESTGEVITAALGALDVDLSGARWLDIIKIIDREQDIREDLAEQMIKLQEAQITLLQARAKALSEGKGVIQITTAGIEPELEQVLYSIIQKAQVKANEEGFNALLGI